MLAFLAALVVFVLAHVVPARPGLRGRLVGWLGQRTYQALYSALSLALLAWLISAAIRAPEIVIWEPARWQGVLALIAVPLALTLIFAGLIKPNPLSVSLSTKGYDPARPGLLAITRHPVLWGFSLWGGAHVAANGDLVGIILFGVLTLFALIGTKILDRRKARLLGDEEWRRLAAHTANAPFVAVLQGRARPGIDRPLLIGITAAVIASAILLAGGHLWLFGADPLTFWR
ncbi:MAG: NnrU family protein [Alphaproteobacteria bacterium]|nr:MAG: NnrU family protein [Alphaproteobacteria bacterium]